jgi:N-acetylmuramoyl-L-alanine amidase
MRVFSLFIIFGVLVSQGWAARLSPLSPEPHWERLHDYQFTITRERFENLLDQLYSPDQGARSYLRISSESMTLYSDQARTIPLFSLFFASDSTSLRDRPRQSRLPQNRLSEKPLEGLRICLDPGHIGGDYAKLEERFFKIDEAPSVEEAKLNLMTCKILEKELQKQGAEIVWTKQDEEPVTQLRPSQLREEALKWIFDLGVAKFLPIEEEVSKRADMLFYRTAEIRSRADRIRNLKPDLTICLHYNAGEWGPDPLHPTLVEKSRLVIFVTGVFMASELKYDDQKYDLLSQLLEQNEEIELKLSSKMANRMKESLQMAPELYKNWSAVVPIKNEPYIYARNLAANRWFEGPTVFVEGPYMNAKDAYERIIAGDYEGEKVIQGVSLPSLYRQFAVSVAQGVVDYYRTAKEPSPKELKSLSPTVWNP